MKSAPITNAWASPSGRGCTAYVREIPHCEPSPSNRENCSESCGVVMIRTSFTPAIISVARG